MHIGSSTGSTLYSYLLFVNLIPQLLPVRITRFSLMSSSTALWANLKLQLGTNDG